MLGGLGAADPDSGQGEPDREHEELGARHREEHVRQTKGGDTDAGDQQGTPTAEPVGHAACGERGDRGRDVVEDIQPDRGLGGGIDPLTGGEDIGGPQDEHGGRDVPDLEGSEGGDHPTERPAQDRPDEEPQLPVCGGTQVPGLPDRVDDRGRGQQAGHDGDQDRRPDAEHRQQAEGEQRPDDRTEVVHRAFEPVGPAVRVDGNHVGEQRVSGRYSQSRSARTGRRWPSTHRLRPYGDASGRRPGRRRRTGRLRPNPRRSPRSDRARRPARPGWTSRSSAAARSESHGRRRRGSWRYLSRQPQGSTTGAGTAAVPPPGRPRVRILPAAGDGHRRVIPSRAAPGVSGTPALHPTRTR